MARVTGTEHLGRVAYTTDDPDSTVVCNGGSELGACSNVHACEEDRVLDSKLLCDWRGDRCHGVTRCVEGVAQNTIDETAGFIGQRQWFLFCDSALAMGFGSVSSKSLVLAIVQFRLRFPTTPGHLAVSRGPIQPLKELFTTDLTNSLCLST